jgi:hypothetical protein
VKKKCWRVTDCQQRSAYLGLLGITAVLLMLPTNAVADLSAPDTGTPEGEREPGTTRPEINCPETAHPVTALVHNQGSDITRNPQPTLWFYIPYSRETVQRLQFVLWDERERDLLLESPVAWGGEPGFLGITLPESLELESGQLYRWYFQVACTGNDSPEFDLSVNGWMQFRQGDSARADMTVLDLIAAGDWYDAIDLVVRSYARDPETYQEQWLSVLDQLEANDLPIGLIGEPIRLDESR